VSKSFNANLMPSSVGTPTSNPPVRNPIVLQVTSVDGSVSVPAGWYDVFFQGNDMFIQMNAATSSTTSPCIPKGVVWHERFLGSKAQGGGTAAALTLHAATVSGTGILTLIPLDPLSTP
jgi:hypothetical protein